MKYIRSKYGKKLLSMHLYEYIGEDDSAYLFKRIYKKKKTELITRMSKSCCTIGDTIEELVDGYVVIKGNHHVYYNKRDWITSHKLLLADIRLGIKKCKAGIWTKNGLSFVAEMNGEEKWELL